MPRRSGLTLLELVVVLTVLVALAALIVPVLTGTSETAQATVTQSNMRQIADVLVRYRTDNGTLPRLGGLSTEPVRLRYLFEDPYGGARLYDPVSKTGWNGPYVAIPNSANTYQTINDFTVEFGTVGEPYYPDLWNSPLVVVTRPHASGTSWITWLQSAGQDGKLVVPAPGTPMTGPPRLVAGMPGAGNVTEFPGTTLTADDVTILLPYVQERP